MEVLRYRRLPNDELLLEAQLEMPAIDQLLLEEIHRRQLDEEFNQFLNAAMRSPR